MTNETRCDDPRPVPTPFGYCAECIREGTWLRAATLHQGTALCAQHLVWTAGPGEIDFPDNATPSDRVQEIRSRLQSGMYRDGQVAGF